MIDMYGKEYDQLTFAEGDTMAKQLIEGVGLSKNGERFVARIRMDGKQLFLGTFDTYEEAKSARLEAESKRGVEIPHKNVEIDWAVREYCRREGITKRIHKVTLQLLTEGMSSEEIASYLGLNRNTIDSRFYDISKKIGNRGRMVIFSEIYQIALGGKE